MNNDVSWRDLINAGVEQALFDREVSVDEIEQEFGETVERLQAVREFREGSGE